MKVYETPFLGHHALAALDMADSMPRYRPLGDGGGRRVHPETELRSAVKHGGFGLLAHHVMEMDALRILGSPEADGTPPNEQGYVTTEEAAEVYE